MFPPNSTMDATGVICIIDADEVSELGNRVPRQNLVPAVCAKCGTEGYADTILVVETQLRLQEGKEITYYCMQCHPDLEGGTVKFQHLSNVEFSVIHACNMRELESYGIDLRNIVSEAVRYSFSRHLVVDFQDDQELEKMVREELTHQIKVFLEALEEEHRLANLYQLINLYKFILVALENDLFNTQILIQFLWMFPAFMLQKGKTDQDSFDLDELLDYCKVRIFQDGRVANKKWGFPIDS